MTDYWNPDIREREVETGRNSEDGSKRSFPPARVIYVIDSLRELYGGGEQALLRTILHLPRDRFEPCVVTFDMVSSAKEVLRELGCPLYYFPMERTYHWSGLKASLAIRRLLRAHKPDIVHTIFETSNTWGGLVTKLSVGALLISSRRDMGILRATKHSIAYKLINRLSDGVHVVSEGLRRQCVDIERIDRQKVTTIYNGVDLTMADGAADADLLKQSFGLNKASHIVATVANIRKVKGLDTLLETADIVRRRFGSVMFAIAGGCNEPSHLSELQRLVMTLGLERNVRFLGPLEGVYPLLKAADVFCLLSRSEGFSNALLEGMACELPCVVTRVGGNPEAIKDGENGFLVPIEDPAAAARRIIKLLETPELATEIGKKARKTVESRFEITMMVEQLTCFYDSLLKSKRTGKTIRRKLAEPSSFDLTRKPVSAQLENEK
jgi:glycosyltransferase involved in cell wall biosynthesis